ncbi:transformer-2 protein [Kwoniella heveanensis BCC8398]|uniref:Transformer-2 protein n=1 Tax=Kwoniella heveanensis BCC8398 TaxID=1296120 RepID=A0A1B9H088_9TREE|nr:transformer-2 protein [Kwoniella heveanensis BCC8398]
MSYSGRTPSPPPARYPRRSPEPSTASALAYPRDPRDSRDRDRDAAYAPPAARRPAPGPGAPTRVDANNVLGVFGLSIRTRERDLEDEFMRYGDVEKVVIVYDQRTDRSRGFGFITMRTVEDATRCIDKLNGLSLHGRNIRVDYSATQKPHAPTPGEYMGVKRPIQEDRYRGSGGGRYDDRRGYDRGRGYDDRRGGYDSRDRYDDRDRYRDRDGRDSYSSSRRDRDDPYGGRSRRDDYERRRSPSPRRSRYSASPDRRAAASRDYDAPRDYDAAPPALAPEVPRY